MPTDGERAERLRAVLHVLYLIFSEGYTSSVGPELHRTDLSNEAIRLTRAVRGLLPNDGEVAGLLALMLLTDARRTARTGASGELIPLDEQDRSLWDRRLIAEGIALVSGALSSGSIGLYQLQAAIAAVHDEAARVEDTDWPQILALYEVLARMSDNPMVSLNRAIACWRRSTPIRACAAIIVSMPSARICTRCSAIPRAQSLITGPPPSARPASRSGTISPPEPRAWLLSSNARAAPNERHAVGVTRCAGNTSYSRSSFPICGSSSFS